VSVKEVRPTIYFIHESNELRQGVDVLFDCSDEITRCVLDVSFDSESFQFDLGSVSKGESTHRVYIPDIRDEKEVRFQLTSGGEATAERKLMWKPQRHWTVYLCQNAHFDPGYTDLPSNVMHEYLGFLDNVVEWCEQTEDWPPESRFHYVIEQAWVALHYVENRPLDVVRRFVHCCRTGQIEVNGFFANMVSGLMGQEEMARLLYPAFQLKRQHGIPIRTAEHNDIPGMSWAYATILADAGIEFFTPGVPDYYHEGEENPRNFADDLIQPRDCPEAFYWEAQNGRKVLVYLHRQGAGGDTDANLVDLPGVLKHLEKEGYVYDVFRYVLKGGIRDNCPPLFDYANTVREWNTRWAYPRYMMGTNYKFFKALEQQLGPEVPKYRGDYPGTDYPIGATSTAEATGVNRIARDALMDGERFAAIAAEITDYEYPRRFLGKAYLNALKYDEHAWGMSSPLGLAEDAHRREKALYAYQAAALAEDVVVKSTNRIADAIGVDEDVHHIVVFNPSDHIRSDVVEMPFAEARTCSMPMHLEQPDSGDPHAPVWRNGTAVGRRLHSLPPELVNGEFELVDPATGESVPHQVIRIVNASYPVRSAAERCVIADARPEYRYILNFIALDVPAVGYKTLKIVRGRAESSHESHLHCGPNTIENEFYRVIVDDRTGGVKSLYDKELRRELVDRDAPYRLNQFFTRAAKDGTIEMPGKAAVNVGRSGPVAVSLVIEGEMPGAPERTQEIVLYRGLKRVEFRNRILKDADGSRRFYIAFPFDVEKPRFVFEGPMNVIRPVEDQLPGTTTDCYSAHHWVNVGDERESWGITWSAREAPAVQFSENWPDYVSQAHHGVKPNDFYHKFLDDPSQFKKGHIYSYVANNNFRTNFMVSQPGVILMTYSVTSHQGDWKKGRARSFGWSFCSPMPHAVLRGRQSGALPMSQGFCEVNASNVAITTIKRAEDGDDVIVRLLETEGVKTEVRVDLPFLSFREAVQTNLVEEVRQPVHSDGSGFSLQMEPWSLASVRLAK
jgi:hypothetical protein